MLAIGRWGTRAGRLGVLGLLVLLGLVSCRAAAPPLIAPTQTRAAELAQIATLTAPTATPLADEGRATATPTLPATSPALTIPPGTALASPPVPSTPSPSAPLGTPAAPRGPIPAGWLVYRGTRLPFVLAYPPDWQVDATREAQGEVVFRAPPPSSASVTIHSSLGPAASPDLDSLRDRVVTGLTAACSRSGIQYTDYASTNAIRFAVALVNCDRPGRPLAVFQLGVGLRQGVEWDYVLHSDVQEYTAEACGCAQGNRERYFTPMLESLNIYANPAP